MQVREGASGTWLDGPQDVAETSTTVTALTTRTGYQVRVRATNDEGDGDWSEAGSGTTATPTPPQGLVASPGNGESTLSWSAPASTGGEPLLHYEARWKPQGGTFGDWTGVGPATSHTVGSLVNATRYTFEVRAVTGEGGGSMSFAVTLDAAAAGTVTVDYETADRTATAGADYTAVGGTLTFAPGDTEQTVSVPILDDAVDDTGEPFVLLLRNVSGAVLDDSKATGTIDNSDPIPKAWLARFGRTVAGHVTDAISERLTGRSGGGGPRLTLGGHHVSLAGGGRGAPDPGTDAGPDPGPDPAVGLAAVAEAFADGAPGAAPVGRWTGRLDGRRLRRLAAGTGTAPGR